MPEPQESNGRILLADSFAISYLSTEEMDRRNNERAGRLVILGSVVLLGCATVVVLAIMIALHFHAKMVLKQKELSDLQNTARPFTQQLGRAKKDGLAGRFAADSLAKWTAETERVEGVLVDLQRNPEDRDLIRLLNEDEQKAAAACLTTNDAIRHALVEKSRERCPQHPDKEREPGWRECPYSPPYHYHFEVWTQHDSYCWRNGKASLCRRLQEINLCD